MSRRKGVTLFIILLCTVGVLLWHNADHLLQEQSSDAASYSERLDRYCHTSLLDETERSTAHEGFLGQDVDDQFELVQLHVVARHGDRTPVSKFQVGSKVFFQCSLPSNSKHDWERLSDLPPPVPLPSPEKVWNTKLSLHLGRESKECGDVKAIGKLTTLGYQQHAFLGQLLRERYVNFVEKFISKPASIRKNLFVHSTDFSRTIHSAAAFLVGFLPDNVGITELAHIHVSSSSFLEAPPIGFQATYQHCPDYHRVWTDDCRKSGYFVKEKERHQLLTSLCSMFNLPHCHLPIVSKVFEHVMIRGCHQPSNMLPCSNKTDKCVDYNQARNLFRFVDWVWRNEHPQMSSIIALMPFLRHSLVDPIDRLIKESTSLKNVKRYSDSKATYRVMLSFTHDDTIVKLLTTLGVPVQEWVPYASRVVFEVWKKKTVNRRISSKDYFVRILFDGASVTKETGPWNNGMHEELISYPILRKYLTAGEYRSIASYNRVCHIS